MSCWKLPIAGKLGDATQVDRQVRRMLADPRAQTLATNFAAQWLTVDRDRRHRA